MIFKDILFNCIDSLFFKKYSKLFFISDNTNWVLDNEINEINNIAKRIGINSKILNNFFIFHQAVFYSNKYVLLKINNRKLFKNKIAFPYFHGYPNTDDKTAQDCFTSLKKNHRFINRLQVSHKYMYDLILDTGIDKKKVFIIPIGINNLFFKPQNSKLKKEARNKYNIPQQAVVIGSFQKDGNGWGEGLEPKMIKGPDIFLKTIKILKESIKDIFVLLSGPSRGFVKKGLEELKIPYKHIFLKDYPEINELYQCLDLYIVSSREEGGPKAVLESMVTGIPLVTTKVGQAMDLVKHGENAFMVDVEDYEGLAFWADKVLSDSIMRKKLIDNGFVTAANNTYESQLPLWKVFFKGFVNF